MSSSEEMKDYSSIFLLTMMIGKKGILAMHANQGNKCVKNIKTFLSTMNIIIKFKFFSFSLENNTSEEM